MTKTVDVVAFEEIVPELRAIAGQFRTTPTAIDDLVELTLRTAVAEKASRPRECAGHGMAAPDHGQACLALSARMSLCREEPATLGSEQVALRCPRHFNLAGLRARR
jgi:hypothetical protein